MIQSVWSINNFKSYHPELQVSCMGASKTISHMQQHFRDGNNLLIALFVIPCPPIAVQPSQVQNCFLLPLVEPSRLSPGWKIVPMAHSEPQQWLSRSTPVQSHLRIPQWWLCSSAGRMSLVQGWVQAACSGWALPHGAGGTAELLCMTGNVCMAIPGLSAVSFFSCRLGFAQQCLAQIENPCTFQQKILSS